DSGASALARRARREPSDAGAVSAGRRFALSPRARQRVDLGDARATLFRHGATIAAAVVEAGAPTSESAGHWAGRKEVGAAWGIRALLAIYRVFGRTLFFVALYPVVTYFYLTNRLARRASREYLTQLTTFAPETPLRPTRRATFKHFLSFAAA